MIYADHAATAPLSKAALNAMMPYLTEAFGNPSSTHAAGTVAARGILAARETLARLLDCAPRAIYFGSGGSEANTQALFTMAAHGRKQGKFHLVSTAFEHPSVLRSLDQLQTQGFSVTLVTPESNGIINPRALQAALRSDTVGVSMMLANNEIGTVQPVRQVAAVCHERGILLHTDAVQAAGHIPVSVSALDADFLTLSGHKFGAPKGVGALISRTDISPVPLIFGGGQERGSRAGTENVPGIVGMAAAFADSVSHLMTHIKAVAALRERLIQGMGSLPQVYLTGDPTHRVPGTAHFCIAGVESETVLALLDERGICASAGSACSAGALTESHVLRSLGIPAALSQGALRISLSQNNTMDEVEQIRKAVAEIIAHLRKGVR